MEDYYLIDVSNMSQKNEFTYQNMINRTGGIIVDKCIGQEIEWLMRQGVITQNSCCGHGKSEPECLIAQESVELAAQLGYDPVYYNWDLWVIKLKTVTEG
jgi:hypothetical protein